ncbi:MAG: ethanolamine ammonia lyase-activating protein, partial [Candidatus Binatia bacterium]
MAKPATQNDNATVMDNIPYYDKWQLAEGIPIVKTFFVQDLKKVELKPWDRTGGNGAFINMEGAEGATGAYVLEISPGKQTNPQRHLYEDLIFVLKGRGATTLWNDKGAKQTFEWHDGSLFALPLNCSYQHFNG